jgi:FolB domain-containing protein
MSSIYIKDLIIEAKHGVHEHEKQTSQRFLINVELTIDLSRAGRSDDLADSLDWSLLRQEIVTITQNNSFNLMERLAQVIADAMLAHRGVNEVSVAVDKIDAFKSGIPGVRINMPADHT